jgi:hypothetical protein
MGKFIVSKPENKRTGFAMRHMKGASRGGVRELPTRASYARGGMIRHYDDGGQVDDSQQQPQTGTFDTPTGSKIADTGNKVLGTITNAISNEIPGMSFISDNAQNLIKKATDAMGFHDITGANIKNMEADPDSYFKNVVGQDSENRIHSYNPFQRLYALANSEHYMPNDSQGHFNAMNSMFDFSKKNMRDNNWYLKKESDIPDDVKAKMISALSQESVEGAPGGNERLYTNDGKEINWMYPTK